MSYTPIEWKDGPQGGTPITAAALNRMEQGIVDAHAVIDAATPDVQANTLVLRDSNGRASVADPTSASHIATKGYVDSHANATSVHGATSSATPNRIIIRDSAGRAKVAAPSASDDIARKAEVDALDPSVRFQVSGCVGGSTNIPLSSGGARVLQAISLAVPSGKSLILKRARFDMLTELRLRIAIGSITLPLVRWTSGENRGDVTPNVLVSDATPLVTVWVQAFNPTTGSVDLQPPVGWWLDFAIVDA